jgi:hypothetical protein
MIYLFDGQQYYHHIVTTLTTIDEQNALDGIQVNKNIYFLLLFNI